MSIKIVTLSLLFWSTNSSEVVLFMASITCFPIAGQTPKGVNSITTIASSMNIPEVFVFCDCWCVVLLTLVVFLFDCNVFSIPRACVLTSLMNAYSQEIRLELLFLEKPVFSTTFDKYSCIIWVCISYLCLQIHTFFSPISVKYIYCFTAHLLHLTKDVYFIFNVFFSRKYIVNSSTALEYSSSFFYLSWERYQKYQSLRDQRNEASKHAIVAYHQYLFEH